MHTRYSGGGGEEFVKGFVVVRRGGGEDSDNLTQFCAELDLQTVCTGLNGVANFI